MLTFRQYIAEALQVPRHVFKEIEDYIIDSYRKEHKNDDYNDQTDTSEAPLDIKKFSIDFTGTRWEFLNYLKPSLVVEIHDSGRCRYRSQETIKQGIGLIFININDDIKKILYSIIEHELGHFLQDLVVVHKIRQGIIEDAPASSIRFYKHMGGLPTKGSLNPNVSLIGIARDKKPVEHTLKPIEHLPDILSMIRSLQYDYYTKYQKLKSKYEYFMNFINYPSSLDIHGTVLKALKNNLINKGGIKLYRYALKKLYKIFMDTDFREDMDEIKNKIEKLEDQLYQFKETHGYV